MQIQLVSLDQTQKLAEQIAVKVLELSKTKAVTLGLIGGLAAGKTTFTQFLLKALGVTDSIDSPSYILCNSYQTANGLYVEHWDLYRIFSGPLPEELVLEERQKNSLTVIEWIDRSPELTEKADLLIELTLNLDQSREVQISGVLIDG